MRSGRLDTTCMRSGPCIICKHFFMIQIAANLNAIQFNRRAINYCCPSAVSSCSDCEEVVNQSGASAAVDAMITVDAVRL